jgi:chorismate-pyruvate lyase
METLVQEFTMALLKEGAIPIGRTMFIPKDEGLTKDSLEVESNGQYQIVERPDRFEIKNSECCRSILIKVKTKE